MNARDLKMATTQSLPATMKARGTLTSAPSLPAKLHGLLMSGDSPIVGPETARQLVEFAAAPEPELARIDQVEVMIGKLAMATAQPKISPTEASERVELYWLALRDLPADDLRAAFLSIVRTAKFLPTPAEIRDAALKAGSARRYAKSRARHLAWKHSVEWQPPVTPISAGEIEQLKAELATALRA
ncbi:hypothetical protein UFOVP152_27 [uncultured Caudovirales phage]|uniref:Uncharacterized protein n=1 Tax=uncultured Caudovirales phage TaxID=2100421 RepID=A0A6J7W8B7_9CAUD|nr:hypothetical protein UFOVP152_27 [uncultured Caudovirales phage]